MIGKYKHMKTDELWKLIRADWGATDLTYKELEKKYGIRHTTIRSRRSREGWTKLDVITEVDVPETLEDMKERNAKRQAEIAAKRTTKEIHHGSEGSIHVQIPHPSEVSPDDRSVTRRMIEEEDLDDGLNDRERLFCLEYMRSFNATKAYQKAYGTTRHVAANNAHKLMKRPHIQEQLDRLKKEQVVALKLDAQDILQQYIDIAFADITDFTEFGMKETIVKDKKGDPTGEVIETPYMKFKDHLNIDGMVVSEVKLGKDGMGIKLHDKMKALEQLTKYFNLLDEHTQTKLQNEKLRMETKILSTEAGGDGNGNEGRTIILSGEDQMREYIAQQKQK